MAASNLPLFGPFVRPVACIFPQHCDLLAISVASFQSYPDLGTDGIHPISFSNFGSPLTPSSFWVSQDITEQVLYGSSAYSEDQTDLNLTLSIGKAVQVTGNANFTGSQVSNLLLWTQGPPYMEMTVEKVGESFVPAAQWVQGYFFVNLSLLSQKYGVGKSSSASQICNITFTDAFYATTILVWAEAIPHARHASFGVPNSLGRLFTGAAGTTSVNAAAMGWVDAHQSVVGWAKGSANPVVVAGNPEYSPVMNVSAYKSGSGYTVAIAQGTGWPVSGTRPTFSTTSGAGSD